MVEVEPVLEAGALLGEGPLWDAAAGRLVWVDILRCELHRFDPHSCTDTVEHFTAPVTAVAPAGEGLIAAVGRDVRLLEGAGPRLGVGPGPGAGLGAGAGPCSGAGPGFGVDPGVGVAPGADAAPGPDAGPVLGAGPGPGRRLATLPTGDRANDGKCDPAGRFLIGTLTERHAAGACALHRIDGPDLVTDVVPGATLANGLGWSPDGSRLYFADTPTLAVDVFDYEVSSGAATGRRRFVDVSDTAGRPDGLTVDAEGGVWVVLARAGQVRRYDEKGRLDAVVDVPAHRTTSCTFGGPDLDELYVTSGRFTMTQSEVEAEPLAGALFRLRPGVRGLPAEGWSGFG